MKFSKFAGAIAFVLIAFSGVSNAWQASGNSGEVWFGPQAPYRAGQLHELRKGADDWRDLFERDAPWMEISRKIRVFTINTQHLLESSDEDLLRVIQELQRRKISLGIEMLAMSSRQDCGEGVEGYASSDSVRSIVNRLRRVNASLEFVLMDEPLWFGHYFSGKNACRSTIEQVVRDVAVNLKIYIAEYPRVAIADIEPVPSLTSKAHWVEDLQVWRTEFVKRVGIPLSYFSLDVNWDSFGWPESVIEATSVLRRLNIRFGIIYNGTGTDTNDQSWFDHAKNNFVLTESMLGLVPDLAYFSSWNNYPTHVLPETEGPTHAHLVSEYLLPKTTFRVVTKGRQVQGRLVTARGVGIANAPLTVDTLGQVESLPLPIRTRTGVVPSGSKYGIIGLRINTECDCSATADFRIGAFSYKEKLGGSESISGYFSADNSTLFETVKKMTDYSRHDIRLSANSTDSVLLNSPRFKVTPGATYELTVSVAPSPGKHIPGYVALIFTDLSGADGHRVYITGRREDFVFYQNLTTNNLGSFSFQRPISQKGVQLPLQITFLGTSILRAAISSVD